MHKSTKLTDISQAVKKSVWERDHHCCVACGSHQAMPNAHVFVSRAHGGKGIAENVVTLCMNCHHALDNGRNAEHTRVQSIVYQYMTGIYPHITREYIREELTL